MLSTGSFIYNSVILVVSEKTLWSKGFTSNLREIFKIKIIVTIIPTNLGTKLLLPSFFFFSYKLKTRIWFSTSWWSDNEKSYLFIVGHTLLQSHTKFSNFYKGIFLHVFPVRIIVPYSNLYSKTLTIKYVCVNLRKGKWFKCNWNSNLFP